MRFTPDGLPARECSQQGDHLERWVGSARWVAEGNCRKVKGYRDLPKLVAAL